MDHVARPENEAAHLVDRQVELVDRDDVVGGCRVAHVETDRIEHVVDLLRIEREEEERHRVATVVQHIAVCIPDDAVQDPVLDRAADIVGEWLSGETLESLMGRHNGFDARPHDEPDGEPGDRKL